MVQCVCGTTVDKDKVACPSCRRPVRSKGRRRTRIGIIIAIAFWAIIILVFWVPSIYIMDQVYREGASRVAYESVSEQERSVFDKLKLLSATQQYYFVCARKYAPSLRDMQPLMSACVGPERSRESTSETSDGYGFSLVPTEGGFERGFKLEAHPEDVGKRDFWVSETGSIKQELRTTPER